MGRLPQRCGALTFFHVLRLTPRVLLDSLFVVIILAHIFAHTANTIVLEVEVMAEKSLHESMRGRRSEAEFASNVSFAVTLEYRNHCNRQQTK